MKVAIVLLVCFAALVSATTPTPTVPGPVVLPTLPSGAKTATPTSGPFAAQPKFNFLISDAGSTGTRMIIGVQNQAVKVVTKLPKIVDTDTSNVPVVLQIYKDMLTNNPSIEVVVIGATAGARNKMTKPDSATNPTNIPASDPVKTIPFICAQLMAMKTSNSALKLKKCKAGVMPGTVEGFMGWYDAWTAKGRKADFCYMELGGMSSQIAVNNAAGKVKGSFSNTLSADVSNPNAQYDSVKVASLSGVKLGFNPIFEDHAVYTPAVTTGTPAPASWAVTDSTWKKCSPLDSSFDFSACKAAVKTWLDTDTAMFGSSGCVKDNLAALAACSTINLRAEAGDDDADPTKPGAKPWMYKLAVAAQDSDFTSSAWCSKDFKDSSSVADAKIVTAVGSTPVHFGGPAGGSFNCARALMWNMWFKAIFGTNTDGSLKVVPTLVRQEDVEWFYGFYKIMLANQFDASIIDAFMAGQTDPSSDCLSITQAYSNLSADRLTPASLRLRFGHNGRQIRLRNKNLRLKF